MTNSTANTPLIKMENVSSRVSDRIIMEGLNWSFHVGQSWGVIGPNGSGKSTLAGLILDQLPYYRGSIRRDGLESGIRGIIKVSFDQQYKFIENEEKKDRYAEYSGREEQLLSVRELLETSLLDQEDSGKATKKILNLAEKMDLSGLLDRPARYLSNGEMRKTLLINALLKQPEFLILDEPFDGLDEVSSVKLSSIIFQVIQSSIPLMLITHRFTELIPEITHVLCLKNGRVFAQGPRKEMLKLAHQGGLYTNELSTDSPAKNKPDNRLEKPFDVWKLKNHESKCNSANKEAVIRFRGCRVSYKKKTILNEFDWTVKRGENWRIYGPNGAGKSTLLALISGDHLQAYSNDIQLFGKQRGIGESIWDIKQKLGLVTPDIQVHYRQPISAFKVVLSGFFDSIGLYCQTSENQNKTAKQWLEYLGLIELANLDFLKISYGQQRMILVARAMVKSPQLLILDEPCQGLDPNNRGLLLKLIDRIGNETPTQLLYVTHVRSDKLDCLHYELLFKANQEGGYKTMIIKLLENIQ